MQHTHTFPLLHHRCFGNKRLTRRSRALDAAPVRRVGTDTVSERSQLGVLVRGDGASLNGRDKAEADEDVGDGETVAEDETAGGGAGGSGLESGRGGGGSGGRRGGEGGLEEGEVDGELLVEEAGLDALGDKAGDWADEEGDAGRVADAWLVRYG